MRTTASLLVLMLLVWTTGCQPKAQITVRVLDDESQPVTEAKVVVLGFNKEQEGKTDRQGRFTATVRTALAGVDIVVDKKGFYSIRRHIHEFTGGLVDRRWQPWNPEVELRLRKMGKPVPMTVSIVEEQNIPAVNKTVGYDLLLRDWISPYGEGKTSDIIVEVLKPLLKTTNDFTRLRFLFTNIGDGLILERIHMRNDYGLRLPALAPEVGYSNAWEWQACKGLPSPSKNWNVLKNGDEDANFYLRVRTKIGENGKIVSAIYGKIYRGIQFGSATYPEQMPLNFTYYLNPDGTRNTESEAERQRAGNFP